MSGSSKREGAAETARTRAKKGDREMEQEGWKSGRICRSSTFRSFPLPVHSLLGAVLGVLGALTALPMSPLGGRDRVRPSLVPERVDRIQPRRPTSRKEPESD